MANLAMVETYMCPLHGLEAEDAEVPVSGTAEATLLLFHKLGDYGAAGLNAFREWERAASGKHDTIIVELSPDEDTNVTVIYTA